MAKYGKRENYDLAFDLVKSGVWVVDSEKGLILGRGRSTKEDAWKPLGVERDGYLRVRAGMKGPSLTSHRVIWEHVNGPSDLNLTINHIDGNPLNNKIKNLELNTNQENCDHAHKVLGRANQSRNKGSVNPRAKLNEDKVREIKKLLAEGVYYKEIAKQFGVSDTTIYSIKRGDNWSHIQ